MVTATPTTFDDAVDTLAHWSRQFTELLAERAEHDAYLAGLSDEDWDELLDSGRVNAVEGYSDHLDELLAETRNNVHRAADAVKALRSVERSQ